MECHAKCGIFLHSDQPTLTTAKWYVSTVVSEADEPTLIQLGRTHREVRLETANVITMG